MAAIRSPPTLEVNGRLIEGTNLASSNPTFGCGFATRGRPREGVACVIWVVARREGIPGRLGEDCCEL
jgi:hypothetical protein